MAEYRSLVRSVICLKMAEVKTNEMTTEHLTTEIEHNISDKFSKCLILRNLGSNAEERDEEHISASMLMGLMGSVMIKIGSELSKISIAMMKNHFDRNNALYMQLGVPTEVIQENTKEFDVIKDPKILELISNDIDPMKIAKYLFSVMKLNLADEVSKCKLPRKTELNNKGCEEGGEYMPVSKLDSFIESWGDNFRSEAVEMVTKVVKILEEKQNATCEKVEAMKEDRRYIIKERDDLLKRLDNMRNEAKITQNYDMLTRLDDIKVPEISKIRQICIKEDGTNDELNDIYMKKRTSIICRFANRNKKLEIISARKQSKGK